MTTVIVGVPTAVMVRNFFSEISVSFDFRSTISAVFSLVALFVKPPPRFVSGCPSEFL